MAQTGVLPTSAFSDAGGRVVHLAPGMEVSVREEAAGAQVGEDETEEEQHGAAEAAGHEGESIVTGG